MFIGTLDFMLPSPLSKLDFKDFFPSIGTSKIFEIFYRAGYTTPLATLFSRLCL